ncbi:MAG TPA: transposase, partial [Lentisphaeria bacterium]|nr:transposase [Lentisphaeria bacterium]
GILHDVGTAAMDMSAGYASVIRNSLLNAAICFDKFHVVQIMNKAVDSTRKEEQKKLSEGQKKLMFGSRFCFLYAWENLPAKHKDKFDEVAAIAVKTSRAWAIKEALRDTLSLSPPDFEPAFKKWHWWATHSRLEHVRKAAKTLKDHLYGIMNAVEYGITNALAEGLNSKIEAIKRAACGYRNKSRFRIAILFHCGKLDLMPNLTT